MLILASSSPRRHELLGGLRVPFRVIPSDASEARDSALDPPAQVVALAERKARSVAARLESGLVLGADTTVVLDGDLLGKPRDDEDAVRMLHALSGREHQVLTGVALVDVASGEERASVLMTRVQVLPLSEETIARYVATGEPRDKAGAYAIQGIGAALIASCNGCFTNVVGLPLCETARFLNEAGLPLATTGPVCFLPNGTPCPTLV